jgi:CHASE2 domain-containing sensor protein
MEVFLLQAGNEIVQGSLLGRDLTPYIASAWALSAILLLGTIGVALQQYLSGRNKK